MGNEKLTRWIIIGGFGPLGSGATPEAAVADANQGFVEDDQIALVERENAGPYELTDESCELARCTAAAHGLVDADGGDADVVWSDDLNGYCTKSEAVELVGGE